MLTAWQAVGLGNLLHGGFNGPGCSPIGEQEFSYSQGQLEDTFDLRRIHKLSSPGDTLPGSVLCLPSTTCSVRHVLPNCERAAMVSAWRPVFNEGSRSGA